MSEQNAYVNAYLELVSSMVHDQLNQIIQLRTQTKLSESLLAQKDTVIAELNNKILSNENSEIEMNNLRERVRIAEDSFHAVTNKVSHMETLQNQFSDVKNKLIGKEKELMGAKTTIETLTKQLEDALSELIVLRKVKVEGETSPKKKINTNKKKESVTLELPAVVTIAETNDF